MSKTKERRRKRVLSPLENRFQFLSDGAPLTDRHALKPVLVPVLDKYSEVEGVLKLWRKTDTAVDDDLRQLWLHEMRQVQRVMSYAGARDLIVDIVEFVEGPDDFGLLLEHAGTPLSASLLRPARQHWLSNLAAQRERSLFWMNMRRLVLGLGIVHAQGLVHGRLTADSVMSEGGDEPDFQLTGFEWSLWISADKAEKAQARLGPTGEAVRASLYSFAEDWRALGSIAARCLGVSLNSSGEVYSVAQGGPHLELTTSERVWLKRLLKPTRLDNLESVSIVRAIDDILAGLARSGSSRAGRFILMFAKTSGLADAVYDATAGEIPIDDYGAQLDWVRADADRGSTLLVPKDPASAGKKVQLVTSTMTYILGPMRQDGVAVWDVAVCARAERRPEALKIGITHEHEIVQPIEIVSSVRQATEVRSRLGPDALDWSAFLENRAPTATSGRVDLVRQSLVLAQLIEAVVRALDLFPVEILECEVKSGRRYVTLRAEPGNERDRIAGRVGLSETAAALKRLFEDDHRDADSKWRLTRATSLGAGRQADVIATFEDVVEHRNRLAYRFEIDDPLDGAGPWFLRSEREVGTESAIARRLRNIKAITTRVDLAEMLDNPWRVRRSSRDPLRTSGGKDAHFDDLDTPKQKALTSLWETLPSYFVVGPPGVGKTRLATEIVRRKFHDDRSARLLLTAQSHDALDHLQDKMKEALAENGLGDIVVVRSATSDRRATSDEDVHRTGLEYLKRLSESEMTRDAPIAIRERVLALVAAAGRLSKAKDAADKDERIGLNAVSSLVLDAANVVISTANSSDIERLVEAREQFDWVIVEEAAKATGPELVGALMLSGRRLLIGDHHQLPPFDADRQSKILRDHGLVSEAVALAEQYVGPLMKDGEVAELEQLAKTPESLREVAALALRLYEPFKTFVEEDERRQSDNPAHRPISSTLTEQRRMDPAIARLVSAGFYENRLLTHEDRITAAEKEPASFDFSEPIPPSPIVVVDFKHVSATGTVAPSEQKKPRYHNAGEADAVVKILKRVAASKTAARPSLVVLSFYQAQVEKLAERIDAGIRNGSLENLRMFDSVLSAGGFVSTVDGFQGNEADLVLVSLVRNNPGTGAGALGFLRDKRRWNVALSRAKSKLIVVGSLSFLREAVRGVNPDSSAHDLAFLATVTGTIDQLTRDARSDGTALASIVRSEALSDTVTAC